MLKKYVHIIEDDIIVSIVVNIINDVIVSLISSC